MTTVTKLSGGLWTEKTLYLVGTPEKEEEMMANINAIRRIVEENMRTARPPVQRAGNVPRRVAVLPEARTFGSENAAYSTALRAAPPQQIRRRVRSEAVARGVEEEGVEMVPLPSVCLAGGFL
ncbi:hypothetical protein BFW01_g363 [Lasiodiplodia theobromae]|uniref:Uncharacterized protein n=1 Tax=Lasiodiplodia theobromae TaxID=45133 RepID=A0A8H7IRV9_9PEZI|nr:hypothetical protein BFW01_g363 [Lasiodiplodia theobromae]